jgi:hypothetical protein
MSDKLSDYYSKEDFGGLSNEDAKLFIKSFVPDDEDVEIIVKTMTRDEIYDLLGVRDLKTAISHVVQVEKVKDALRESVKAAEAFLKSPPSSGSTPSTGPTYKALGDIESWKTSAAPSVPTVIDDPDSHLILYKFDYNNPKSLFLAIVFAVPEILNELVLNFTHVDMEDVSDAFTGSDTVKFYKEALLDNIKDKTQPDETTLDLIATLSFVSFGKIIEIMHDIFEELSLESSETRVIIINFILEVATVGIRVNDGEEVWGREDKIIDGVSIKFNSKLNELVVVNQKAYINKHTELEQFKHWLPSSLYYKYNIHGREMPLPMYKTSKEFWDRVIFDGYDTNKPIKNTFRYIKSRIR